MMKTSTVIYHIAEHDIKEDDSIYELNLLAGAECIDRKKFVIEVKRKIKTSVG